jgi:hypothetical protein
MYVHAAIQDQLDHTAAVAELAVPAMDSDALTADSVSV